MRKMRTYRAYAGMNTFTYESEHRAGSKANMEDAELRCKRMYGRVLNIARVEINTYN